MKTIMLVCNAGMSTSMLVTKMQKAAETKGGDYTIFAVPLTEVDYEIAQRKIDVILIGPQVKFVLNDYKAKYESTIKVDAINMMDYGTMNGEKVLNTALEMLGE